MTGQVNITTTAHMHFLNTYRSLIKYYDPNKIPATITRIGEQILVKYGITLQDLTNNGMQSTKRIIKAQALGELDG